MRSDRSDVRLSARSAVETVGVALRRDDHDDAALNRAMATAAQHGARLVIIAPYEPVAPRELARAHRDAPADVLGDINPVSDIESFLERRAGRAVVRGLAVTTVAVPGRGDRAIVRAAHTRGVDLLVGVSARDARVRPAWSSLFAGPARRGSHAGTEADAGKAPAGSV